jgi:small-conductance mechanosensitive channel
VDVREKHQLDMAGQVARVRARARPWRSIIALVLAVIAAGASWWAINHGRHPLAVPGHRITLAGHPADRPLNIVCAIAFCLLALVATLGLSGKARETLVPGIGSAHAAVVRYALVLVGGLVILLITLELVRAQVGNLILGGAFTAVLIGIAAQQTLGNLFAGIVLLLARPFAVGDSVRMRAGVLSGQIEGVVTDIGITYVRLDTEEGKLNVPNSQVLAAAVGPLRDPRTTADRSSAAAALAAPASAAVPAAPAASAAGPAAAAAPPAQGAAPQHAVPVTGADGSGQAGSAERGAQR